MQKAHASGFRDRFRWPAGRAAFCAGLLLCALTARADGLDYQVQIDAPADLKALLEQNLELIRWRGNARIDAEQLQRLYRQTPEEIKALLETEGYYAPEIAPQIEQRGAAWQVRLRVTPGQPVVVGSIELVFLGPLASQAQDQQPSRTALRSNWALPAGRIFRQQDWEAAKAALLRQVIITRYPGATLSETRATVDPESHRVALRVVLDSGPGMTFGAVNIEGLSRYPADIVSRDSPVKPGEVYSETALRTLQGQLQDSGYFSRVEVVAEPQPDQSVVPVTVTVVENQKKKAGVGIGYSTNTGKRAHLTYEDLNVLDRNLKIKSALTLETKKQTLRGDLYFPVTPEGYRHSIGVSYERAAIEGEVTRLASLAAKRQWGQPSLERNLSLEYVREQKTVAGLEQPRSQALPLSYGVTLRRTDSLLFPTDGYVLTAQLGGALQPLLTDRTFTRAYAKAVHYRPLGKSGNLILRGEFGAVASIDKQGIPDAFLFRAGGDQSVRGYAYQSLGVAQNGATVGGRYLAVGSAEYQYWFLPKWGAAVFADAGNAADNLRDLAPSAGYGLGARWRSPVGPISVDLAYGRKVEEFRLHFSLGASF
ncbi:MAG TPA: autotransporter assembly complex family protein [Paucimonas sp.]|nr:autotransporter assembly complex family protein [Paucimonas sp.]